MKLCLSCSTTFEKDDWLCPSCNKHPQMQNGWLVFSPELSNENQDYDLCNFEQLAKVESTSFWFCARNKLLIWTLGKYFPEAKNFLEIGCGTGFVLSGIEKEFPALELYGSEIFNNGLEIAKNRVSRTKLIQADARKIPFKEEFDIIGAFDILEHIKEDEAVLKEMYQALKPKGGIILTVPQHGFLWSQVDKVSHHIRRYSVSELKNKVESCGFKLIRKTSFVSFLFPLILLSRLRWRNSSKNVDCASEFNLNPLVNYIFEMILRLENLIIKTGFSFPLGSSLLLIAKKL